MISYGSGVNKVTPEDIAELLRTLVFLHLHHGKFVGERKAILEGVVYEFSRSSAVMIFFDRGISDSSPRMSRAVASLLDAADYEAVKDHEWYFELYEKALRSPDWCIRLFTAEAFARLRQREESLKDHRCYNRIVRMIKNDREGRVAEVACGW